MKYNFPMTVFVNQVDNRDQLNKIISEANETLKEVGLHTSPLHPELLDEITDLYHAVETYIRMNEKAFEESFTRVFEKNKARGYYWRKNRKDPENRTDEDLKEYIEEIWEPDHVIPVSPSPVKEGYVPLYSVLMDALEQAQNGKGSERHGQNLPFEEQPIVAIPKLQNSDIGLMYQAIKKLQESQRMETEPAIRERLGAINYIAASILFLKERSVKWQGKSNLR